MDFEKQQVITRGLNEMAQELLGSVNGLWRELTLKSKPRKDFVDEELSNLKNIADELRRLFFKGSNHVGN